MIAPSSSTARLLKSTPPFALAHFDLGGALGQKKRFAEAIAEFQAGFQSNPNDAGATAELGYVYARAGRRGEAQKTLETLRDLSSRRYIASVFPGAGACRPRRQ